MLPHRLINTESRVATCSGDTG